MTSSAKLRAATGLLLLSTLGRARPAGAAGEALFKIDPSARSAALGSASTAVPGDAWALFGNPALLSGAAGRQLLLTHAVWLEGDAFQAAGLVLPGKTWTAGAGLLRLSHGEIEGRDAQRRPTGTFSAEDQAFSLSAARRWGPLGAGGSLKRAQERIGGFSAASWALDGGVSLSPAGAPLSWGAALRNWNPRGSGVEASASLGTALRSPGLGLLKLDVLRSLDGRGTEVRAGLERWVMNALALRAGYAPALRAGSGAPAWRAGLGFRRAAFQVDYALVPIGELGTTQRMSMSLQF